MFSNQPTRNTVVTWRRFSGKGYAAFRSLGREIRIGVLAVSTLMAAHNDSLATRTDSLRIVKDAISSSDLSLSEATVTGSQLPVSLDKAWSKIVVISRQEIDNAKCQTINDILKLCPNVDVRQRGAMGVQTDISLGGGTFDQITFMLNGININNPQTGHLAADFPVAIADIERIEILDGASARTFGSQALNGIINIITRTEPTSQVGIHAEGGSYGTFGGGANANIASGKTGGTALWRNRLSGDYLRTDGAVQNSDFNRIRLFYQGRYTADNVLLNWQAGYNKQRYGANTFYSAKFPNQWEEGT
ncbi:MAG: TonB-dependent receptor, partial [Bacteroidaceae bacterium]|nr:TonB-dependent receptor [Bacteroidaceae bacterium]